jgi:Heterokaryon incompatibility protein (HET)
MAGSNSAPLSLPIQEPVKTNSPAWPDLPVDLPAYTYQPLKGDRITRVLKVHGVDSYETSLTFEIFEIDLDSAPEYYAISYCWEGQKPTRKVICEGKTLLITINCEAALKQFRRRHDETIFLWIDAICINQATEGVLERNHQVLMMGEIYAAAAQVLVWLGSDRLQPLPQKTLPMLKWLCKLSQAASESDVELRKDEILKIALDLNPKGVYYVVSLVLLNGLPPLYFVVFCKQGDHKFSRCSGQNTATFLQY